MNRQRRKAIESIIDKIDELKSELEDATDWSFEVDDIE